MDQKKDGSGIKLILFDVDGVLTDGTIYVSGQGELFKAFNVKDGLAIELLRCHNILTGIVSGKSSDALEFRCNQLNFDFVVTGCKNKLPRVLEICKSVNIELCNVAFCGDDVLDLPVMEQSGLSIAPLDAHQLVLEGADIILNVKGGRGVAREAAERILSHRYSSLIDMYQTLLNKIVKDDVNGVEQ
jgi:3-deoxy-D-manno-octulosonate 8-phosphate phosphatase (KDO 8-P phosphatase)